MAKLDRTRQLAALAGSVALVAAACTGPSAADRTGDEATPVGLATVSGDDTIGPLVDVPGYTDGFNHFVVTTADTVEPDDDLESFVDLSSVERLLTADGPVAIEVSPGSLRIVAPATPTEEAALEQAGDATIAFLVEDRNGAVDGTPGRYLLTDADLTRIESTDDQQSTESAGQSEASDPDAFRAVVGSGVDIAVTSRIARLDDTIDAQLVAPGVISVTTEGEADQLAAVPGVDRVHVDVTYGLSDPLQGQQWALENTGAANQANGSPGTAGVDIDAATAWETSLGAGIVVAVIDSGVQLDHPDLAGRFHTNPNETCGNGVDDDGNGFVDDCTGWDFGSGDANPSPDGNSSDAGHGTHVAGIIAAGDNDIGVVGVAPDSLIMPIKVSDAGGLISSAALTGAIDYAWANGADVINMSLGTSPGVPRSSVSAIEAPVARAVQSGAVVVAAAGNNGVDITNNPVWPASLSEYYSGVITAGSSNNNDARSGFSNYGSPISIWAPGEAILATGLGSGHEWRSGTSMATPVVAGAAALLLAVESETPGDLRTRMQSTGVAAAAGTRLDAAALLGTSTATSVSVAVRGADSLVTDQLSTLSIDVSANNAAESTDVRLSMATLDQGAVAAVEGLDAQIAAPGVSTDATTDAAGAFPLVPINDAVSNGFTIDAQVTMPAGRYALVTELIDGDGDVVGDAQVVYFDATTAPSTPATTQAPSATTTAPPQTTTTTTIAEVATTSTTIPVSVTTTAPNGGSSGGQPPSAPTTVVANPVGPTVPATTTPTSSTSPETSTTTPATTSPSAPNSTTPTTPTTTAPAAQPPSATTPTTTTPAPEPDESGLYSLTGIRPRSGSVAGGEIMYLDGEFPTHVDVFVWWGSLGIAEVGVNSGTRLVVRTPPVSEDGLTDVSVRFTTSTSHVMTLSDAYTFNAINDNRGPTGGGSGGSSTPAQNTPQTTAPGSATTTTAPTTTQPAPTATTTTTAPATTVAPVTTEPGSSVRTRGALTLQTPANSSAIAALTPGAWPTGCASSSCAASALG